MVRVIGTAFVLFAWSVTTSVIVYVPSATSVVSHGQLQVRGSGGALSTGLRQMAPLAGPPKVTSTCFTPLTASVAVPWIVTVPATGPTGLGSIAPLGVVRSTFTWS